MTNRGLWKADAQQLGYEVVEVNHYLLSGNWGSIGVFEVRAQNRASNAAKQCSGVHTELDSSSTLGGCGGTRDMISKYVIQPVHEF